ncbi:unnamed protein product [Ostreobium quekettii]|uniref:Arsenite methyltransferase n=1 Tax=Ostreobium quekettii TaxID=121088 RepID=A0A8S1J668_9CHLO|nr:unnamed protein product [Ostreobium quekettii]|eukprot:evm.model.scf_957.2 EVM.evm.TU.scf_957.2   scf_957:23006-26179(-)
MSNCCGSDAKPKKDPRDFVEEYYGKILATSKDLKTNACCAAGRPGARLAQLMSAVPAEIMEKFYGCGAPLPLGIDGKRVLDLGSGSGRDCYVAAALVGASGRVTGIDMTEEQLDVARSHLEAYTGALGYNEPNMNFVKGHIEFLEDAGVEGDSVDVVISNCVVNLSPDKPRVLREVYRALAPGGEFYFSDVYCDRRLPESVRENEVLWGECIAGALYIQDFERMARETGFADPRVLSTAPIAIQNAELEQAVGEAKFYSITYRLFKIPDKIEPTSEDYGQYAIYKGTIEGHEHAYELDDKHHFETGKPMLVDGNTAAMVGEDGISWLSPHFQVVGDRSVHYGRFGSGNLASSCATGSGRSCC